MGWQTAIQSSILLTQSAPFNISNPAVPFTMIGPGGTQVFGPFDVNQTAYEIGLTISTPGATAVPFMQVEMLWTDSATGLVVSNEHWNLAAGTSPAGLTYYGTGPTKGDTLTVTFSWFAAGAAVLTVQKFALAQSSRNLLRDDWKTLNMGPGTSVPGFTNATYDVPANTLLSTSPTIGATSSVKRIMPLYSGIVQVSFVPGAGSTGCHFVINNEADQSGLTATTVFQTQTNNNNTNPVVTLPRSVCSVSIFNDNASSNTVSLNMTIQETPP